MGLHYFDIGAHCINYVTACPVVTSDLFVSSYYTFYGFNIFWMSPPINTFISIYNHLCFFVDNSLIIIYSSWNFVIFRITVSSSFVKINGFISKITMTGGACFLCLFISAAIFIDRTSRNDVAKSRPTVSIGKAFFVHF